MKRAGLFNGYWYDLEGQKLRRIRRDDYPMLYRVWREHRDIRLGVRPFAEGRLGGPSS